MNPAGNPFDQIWESQKEQLKATKVRIRWKRAAQQVKPKIPKRLTSIKEMWKYYITHCNFHALRYWLDKQFHPLERIIWVFAFFIGFGWAFKTVIEIYNDFQLRKSNIIIDEINTGIDQVPFPSITVCPPSRVDWAKALEITDTLIPDNEKAKEHFLDLLDKMSTIRYTNIEKLELNTNDSTILDILDDINMTDVMLSVLPKCETFLFNCSWGLEVQSCCDVFEIHRSVYGYCYSFNSFTSESSKDEIPRVSYRYGVHTGLRFSTTLTNYSLLPPSSQKSDYKNTMPFLISDVHVTPLTGRYLAFGSGYYISLKFTCGHASESILALENVSQPPCKHNRGRYKYQNCILTCMEHHLRNQCQCNPMFLYETDVDNNLRICNLTDIKCLAEANRQMFQLHEELNQNNEKKESMIKKICKCPNECEYYNYDSFIGTVPLYYDNNILVDVHFDGPTGVCYKREMVVTSLDMLVQFGGIFGLFVGGSVISCAELLYSILLSIVYFVYYMFSHFKKKKIKIRPVIEVSSCNDNVLPVWRKK